MLSEIQALYAAKQERHNATMASCKDKGARLQLSPLEALSSQILVADRPRWWPFLLGAVLLASKGRGRATAAAIAAFERIWACDGRMVLWVGAS